MKLASISKWKQPIAVAAALTLLTVSVGQASATPTFEACNWPYSQGPYQGTTESPSLVSQQILNLQRPRPHYRYVNAKLKGLVFPQTSASMKWSCLLSSDLSQSEIKNYDLTLSEFHVVDITGTDFSGSNFTGIRSTGLIGTPKALPLGWQLIGGSFVGPTANLAWASFSGLDLSKANLDRVKSGHIDGAGKLPRGWTLAGGYLLGARADLTDAILSAADITGVDLSSAILDGLEARGLTGKSVKLPAGYIFLNGNILGPSTSLANLNIQNLDLSKVTFKSNLQNGTISGTPKRLPSGFKLANGWLIGPGVLADNADLSFADLSTLDLKYAHLQHANLKGANLSSTKLGLALLYGADISGANMKNAAAGPIVTTGIPSELPIGWFIENGSLYMGSKPEPYQIGQLSGAATSDPTGANVVYYSAGVMPWKGIPQPNLAMQWYLCSQSLDTNQSMLPKLCSVINGQKEASIAVLGKYKGKYLTVGITASNLIGNSTIYLKSSSKVR